MEIIEQRFHRRGFIKFAAAGAGYVAMGGAGGLALAGAGGCNVFDDILNWIPVADASIEAIVQLLENAGVLSPVAGAPINAALGLVDASVAQLKADVAAYKAITPPPAGALAKIQAGLQIVATNFQAFLAALKISDSKLLQLVVGLAQIILSTIAGFEGTLSQQPGAAAPITTARINRTYRVAGETVSVLVEHRSRRKFKKDWNSLAEKYGHSEIKMHVSLLEYLPG